MSECGTIFHRIEFSAIRARAQVFGRRMRARRRSPIRFSVHFSLAGWEERTRGYLSLARSPQFFIRPRLFRLPLTLLPPQSFALLSGLSFAALNKLFPSVSLRVRPRPSSLCTSSSSPFLLLSRPRVVLRRPPDPTDRAIAPASLGVFAFDPLKGRLRNYYLRHRLKIPPRTRIERAGCRLRERARLSLNLCPRLRST